LVNQALFNLDGRHPDRCMSVDPAAVAVTVEYSWISPSDAGLPETWAVPGRCEENLVGVREDRPLSLAAGGL